MEIAGRVVVVTGGGSGIGSRHGPPLRCRWCGWRRSRRSQWQCRQVCRRRSRRHAASKSMSPTRIMGKLWLRLPSPTTAPSISSGLNAGIATDGGVEASDAAWQRTLGHQLHVPRLCTASRTSWDAQSRSRLSAPHCIGRRPSHQYRGRAVTR